jgi:[protein-PII] uridylyltransferase
MVSANRQGPDAADGRQQLAVRLRTARRQFTADVERGLGGRAAHARFADRMDDLVRQIVGAATAPATPWAVCAMGGYGRRTLCLHSDVDLLVVFEGRIGRAEERFVRDVLHPLWDLDLAVGQQVRALADFAEVEADNPEFLLALQDVRPVTGDQGVFEALDARVRHPDDAWREALVAGLRRLTGERHAEHADTIHQLEPDLKNAPGGLRDLAAARVLTALSDESTAAMIEEDRLDQAENFLLRVRSVLHLEAGRNMNVLTHTLQERAAARLRIPGAGPQQRVEALMGRYFGHARVVARMLSRAWRAATPAVARPTIVVNTDVRLTPSGVDFADQDRASGDPASWFQLFEVAVARGEPVADDALALIERRAGRYALTDLLPTRTDRARVLAWLRPARGLYARLSELHDCGLLGRLFPGFAAISSRVIRDFYHKFTVDEHTLLTIRNVERLLDPEPGRERFAALLGELLAPERLVAALLLHDVGKWKEEDHAAESARMATSMLRQLDASDEASADILFLIEQHLQMSQRALRRDGDDPETARQLAVIVGTEERLKMLCLLTLADIGAVGPGTLTPWKEELLWRLYVDTYNELTIAYADRVIDAAQGAVSSLQAARPADLEEADLTRFLEGLPQRYLSVVDRRHVYDHARLARDVHRDEVRLLLERRGDAWDLAVVTLDKPELFSNICGVLSYLGMDILRGSVMTSTTGLVLDLFQFEDREAFLARNATGAAELEALLQDVVAGRRDAADLVRRKALGPMHRRKGPSRVRPVVYFETDHSAHYTVLEIVAGDALGLLYRVSRIISEHGCSVELVLIATEGQRAIDVFHLTGPGGKLPALARGALKADLERMLEETDDED